MDETRQQRWVGCGLMIVGGVLLVGWLLAMGALRLRDAAHKAMQQNNAKQFGLAAHNYADANREKSFPAVLRRNDGGEEGLSWRVDLVPYIDGDPLYREAKFDEAWDSPANLRILSPYRLYQLADDRKDTIHTPVRAFAGGGVWDEAGAPRHALKDVPGGLANVGLFFLTAERIPWTRAAEPAYAPGKPLPRMLYPYGGVTIVSMADGSVRAVRADAGEAAIRLLIEGSAAPE